MDYTIPVGFHFSVEFLPGFNNQPKVDFVKSDMQFQEVNGLSVTVETEDYIEGGENRFVHTLPVRTKYADLELKRGLVVNDSGITDWIKSALEDFNFSPVNLVIMLLNEQHEPLVTWQVYNAIPIEWTIDSFNAMESKLVIESLKLSYQYFEMKK